jgi:hypothetical protein
MITTLMDRFRLWRLRRKFEKRFYLPDLKATKEEQWQWFCEFEDLGEAEVRRRLDQGIW